MIETFFWIVVILITSLAIERTIMFFYGELQKRWYRLGYGNAIYDSIIAINEKDIWNSTNSRNSMVAVKSQIPNALHIQPTGANKLNEIEQIIQEATDALVEQDVWIEDEDPN